MEENLICGKKYGGEKKERGGIEHFLTLSFYNYHNFFVEGVKKDICMMLHFMYI